MQSAPSSPILSLCIGTFNRAEFLGQTLQSVTDQVTEDCEVLVLDNASTDGTAGVVQEFSKTCRNLRYVRQDINKGVDCNFDTAVEEARGQYCWLLADDDLMKSGAIERVLSALRSQPSLVFVDMEYKDFRMERVVQKSMLRFTSDRVYESHEMDRLFGDLGEGTWFIGSFIVRRSIWLERERRRYYGSLFIYVPVMFQAALPGRTVVIAEPLMSYRTGNSHAYGGVIPAVVFEKWPTVVEQLAISDATKRSVPTAQPWDSPRWLLVLRGWGHYSLREYRRWVRPKCTSMPLSILAAVIAILPGALVNVALLTYFSIRGDRGRELQWLRGSRFNLTAGWRRWRSQPS